MGKQPQAVAKLERWKLEDANVISEVSDAKPDRRVQQWIGSLPEHTLFLSVLTLAEYQEGIQHLPPGDKLRPRLQQAVIALEARFSGRILSVSDPIVLRGGTISGEMKRLTGHSPSVIDPLLPKRNGSFYCHLLLCAFVQCL
ncbi:MAG: PIN domain-containing protein [Acidobacteriaceae bacterium]